MAAKKKSKMPSKKKGSKKLRKAMMMGDPGTLPPPGLEAKVPQSRDDREALSPTG